MVAQLTLPLDYSPVFTPCFPHTHTPVCHLLGVDGYALDNQFLDLLLLYGRTKMLDSLSF